jgi:gamma-glutamyltranspeptidase/glutathione hydrolase
MLKDQPGFESRWQGRSVVVSRDGIVAAESPLAAQTGATILAQGGHAVDAAVATNAVMGVVAPHSNGIGGDLFAMIFEAPTGALHGLNASGWAPEGLSIEWLKKRGVHAIPGKGIYSVTLPGVVDGWEKLLNRFGRMRFAQVLAPAIRLAAEGFPVTEWSAHRWTADRNSLDTNALRTFLPNGIAPSFGEIFKNADLAKSLEQLATDGRGAFYEGAIARRIIETSERYGGAFTFADLREFSSEWVQPVPTVYRGWTVYELPPNCAGIAALAMLNIMENFLLETLGHNSADSLHIMIEAKKLAYADMLQYVGDPHSKDIPLAEILSKSYARKRSQLIDMKMSRDAVEAGQRIAAGNDTTYLSVVDREGNMVSLIQSNFVMFGSGIVPEACGFVLQNRGALFNMDASHPNALAGRKRPLHTIIPAFMSKGDLRIAFGIQGGWNQAQAHAQFVSNIADHGMNIQAALEASRFTKLTFEGCDVQMEARVSPEERDDLSKRGHRIEVLGDYSDLMGGGQAVLRDFTTRINYGASDPRKDGSAIPEPPINAANMGSGSV